MKKALISFVILLVSVSGFAQIRHGLKVDGNFSTVNTNGSEYGTDIHSVFCPGAYYSMLVSGDHWGYLLEMGVCGSGFKGTSNGYESTIKVTNLDFDLLGVQYAFLDDWAKVRPVVQRRFGLRLTFPTGKISGSGQTADFDVENMLDLPWSVSGGVMINNHSVVTIGYGGGILDYLTSGANLKNRQLSVSATYYF